MNWLILLFAIAFEIGGTLTLKFTHGMTRLWPTVAMFAMYLCAVYGLTIVTNETQPANVRIPVGTAYAVWSGVGTLTVGIIGALWFKEPVSVLRALCILAIVAGVSGLYVSGVE